MIGTRRWETKVSRLDMRILTYSCIGANSVWGHFWAQVISMWNTISTSINAVLRFTHNLHLSREQWIAISVVVVVIGVVSLRGFGSRKNY